MTIGLLDYNLIRSSPTKIYLGEMPDEEFKTLPSNVKVLINLSHHSHQKNYSHTILHFPLMDCDNDYFCPKPQEMYRFLEAAHIYTQTQDTYWHCQAGMNRSALMLAAYLHVYDDSFDSMKQVIQHLRSMRGDFILNNQAFEKFLLSL